VAGAPTDQMAIWSVVCAGLGLPGVCCFGIGGLILGPVAFFLGNASINRIRASNGTLGGETLAQLGRIGGAIVAILGLLFLVYIIVAAVNSGH